MTKTISFVPFIPAQTEQVLTLDFNKPFVEQVKSFFNKSADLTETSITGYFGQGVAAILGLPVLEMSCGLPNAIAVMNIGTKEIVGKLDLADFRHSIARPMRSRLGNGIVTNADFILLDGAGRGLQDYQKKELEEVIAGTVEVLSIPIGHIDFQEPTNGILETIIATGISFDQLTSGKILYLPPGLGLAAAIQATALYGLSEVWIQTIRMNQKEDGRFHVEEVVRPQELRQFGVKLAQKWRKEGGSIQISRDLLRRLIDGHPDFEAVAEAKKLLK